METELKRVGSIVDRIQVFTLLAKEKVRSTVAVDAGLTAKILQILQTLTRNFFSGFSNSLISFNKSWKCSICLSFIKTLNVASSTFKSLIFTSVAYFSRTIFISADVSSPFNVLISRDSKFSSTKNDGWSKRSHTEDSDFFRLFSIVITRGGGVMCFGSAFVSFKIMQQRAFEFFSPPLQDRFFDELILLNLF